MITYRKHEYSQYCSERMNVGLRMAATCFLGILLVFHPSHLQADETQPVESQTEVAQTATEITKARERRGRNPIGISTADNGVTIVNIAAPKGSANLSHNKYDKFIIGQQGAILNNSNQNDHTSVSDQTSDLGGQIATNSNLTSAGSASVILNEIKSSHPSMLKGQLEVHGQNAELIIANPNGITCDGCGFINTSKATLTTGTPELDANGALSLAVDEGRITIGTTGAALQGISVFNLISKEIDVDGDVRVRDDLNLVAGQNDYVYQSGVATHRSSASSVTGVAIDSAHMRGMYAGRIKIISNDRGAGVNMNGPVVANAHGVTMTANGTLTLKNVQANETGNQASSGDITITATRINMDQKNADNTDAPDDNTDALNATDNITLNSANISAQRNRITSLGALNINSSSSLQLTGGIYYAGGHLQVASTGNTTIRNAELNSENSAMVNTTSGWLLLRDGGERIAGNEGVNISAVRGISNNGNIYSAKNINIVTTFGPINNYTTGQIIGKGDVTLNTTNTYYNSTYNYGTVNGDNSLTLKSRYLRNYGNVGSASGNILTEVIGYFENYGKIYSGASSVFKVGSFYNGNGDNVVAETDLTISGLNGTRSRSIRNVYGNIEAITGNLTLKANEIENKSRTVNQVNLQIPTYTEYMNQGNSTRYRDVTTHPNTLLTVISSSKLIAGGNITVDARSLTNEYNSQIHANGNISLTANRITNEGINRYSTVVRETQTRPRHSRCVSRVFGVCANRHHWWGDWRDPVPSSQPNKFHSSINGTIHAGGSLRVNNVVGARNVRGYTTRNSVRSGANQISLSSGSRALDAVSLSEVSASKNLVDLWNLSSE